MLTPAQARTLTAVADRLLPDDEHGPGAVAAGAVDYVLEALAGEYAALAPDYAAALDELGAAGFADRAPEEQDAMLARLERDASPFFELVRRHVFEGMFGDPAYGGNRDGAGWALIGYEGPRREWSHADQAVQGREEARAS